MVRDALIHARLVRDDHVIGDGGEQRHRASRNNRITTIGRLRRASGDHQGRRITTQADLNDNLNHSNGITALSPELGRRREDVATVSGDDSVWPEFLVISQSVISTGLL